MEGYVNLLAVSPTTYAKMKPIRIVYTFVATKFGQCLIGATEEDHRICYISFCEHQTEAVALAKLNEAWPRCIAVKDDSIAELAAVIFEKPNKETVLDIYVKGTELQVNVWKELLKLKEGTTVTYEEMARKVRKPKAIRAVASAVARNRIAYLIPCHRVVHKSGNQSKYGAGPELKERILKLEAGKQ